MARLGMPSLYAVPAIRIGPDVRTLATTVAAVTAIAAGNDHLGAGTELALGGPVACHRSYAPRDPAASVLYQVVRDHSHTFRAEASQLRDGEGLPRFVDEEFDAFRRCGWHADGFARFRYPSCSAERLVAFSCQGRGFCPSCGHVLGHGRPRQDVAARHGLDAGVLDDDKPP